MDDLAATWDTLLDRLRDGLVGTASVVETHRCADRRKPVFAQAQFRPADGGESMMLLICLGEDDLLLCFGDGTNCWELAWDEEDEAFIQRISEAVGAGQWKQYGAPGRRHLEVGLDDGTVVEASTWSAPAGLLPLPGWLRRAKARENIRGTRA